MAAKKIVTVRSSAEFETSDVALAGYLVTRGVNYLRTVRVGMRTSFVFPAAQAEPLRTSWYGASGQVSALSYANVLRDLKLVAVRGE